MSHHIVAVEALSFQYPDATQALRNISFRIHHGECVGLIGANGAGKSTLLQQLNGYLTPTSGTVQIGDFPITPVRLDEVRRTVGMVFQNPDDQLFMPTVFEDVAFGPRNMGLDEQTVAQRVTDALGAVSAGHLAHKPPYRLSTGEKKRVAIATVLAMEPSILVMDEPTAGLDPYARREIMGLLAGFSHTRIITSHDLDMVAALCSRVLVLREGEIVADGSPEGIFNNSELLHSCHLEQPLSMQACAVCSNIVHTTLTPLPHMGEG